jgi:hypothetical protein
MITVTEMMHKAWPARSTEAAQAMEAYKAYCGGVLPPRVPGCDTIIRMAIRIDSGKTIEEAAAAEYKYRWLLGIKAPDQCDAAGDTAVRNPCVSIFGAPHTIGM